MPSVQHQPLNFKFSPSLIGYQQASEDITKNLQSMKQILVGDGGQYSPSSLQRQLPIPA